MAYLHLLGLWALTFLHISFVRSLSSCNANLYGKPFVKDCFDLYDELPGGAMSANVDVDKPRSFVEPKFLEPAFCPVPNPYSTKMVQLPKVWRGGQSLLCDSSSPLKFRNTSTGTCRYALMSIADSAGMVHEPTSIDHWRTVLNAVIDSVQSCVLEDNGAGGMRFANSKYKSSHALSLKRQ